MLMEFGRGFNFAALTIIDQAGVITGSLNFMNAAEQNVENLLVLRPKDQQWSMVEKREGHNAYAVRYAGR
jgi:hypothetical protein